MDDKINEIFSETIFYLVIIDDVKYLILLTALLIYGLITICLFLFARKNSDRKRAATFAILFAYDICVFILAFTFRWWFAIILSAVICFYLRKLEAEIWRYETEKKKIEGNVNDLMISVKGILLNTSLTFFIAQFLLWLSNVIFKAR